MNQVCALIKLGSMVRVDWLKINGRVPLQIEKCLKQNPECSVIDYKMTDGGGIGLILRLNDGSTCWFFEDEIKDLPSEIDTEDDLMLLEDSVIIGNKYRPNKSNDLLLLSPEVMLGDSGGNLSNVLNPFNFIKWLIYSLKDVY